MITIIFWHQNADLLKKSVFIFFDKTSLQKAHCIITENASSKKM